MDKTFTFFLLPVAFSHRHIFSTISASLSDLNGRIINQGDFVIVTHTRDRFLAYITKVERKCGKFMLLIK